MSFYGTLSRPTPSKSAAALFAALLMCLSAAAPLLGQTSSRPESESESEAEAPRLSIDRLYSLPNLIGTAPTGFAWSADGRYLAFLWNDEGRNFHDVWLLDADDPDGAPQRVTWMPQSEAQATDPDDPVAAVEARSRIERDRGVSSVIWHPNGRQVLMSFRGDLWLVAPGSAPRRVTETRVGERQAAYHPMGTCSPS